jgi:hypothetical protein
LDNIRLESIESPRVFSEKDKIYSSKYGSSIREKSPLKKKPKKKKYNKCYNKLILSMEDHQIEKNKFEELQA